MFINKNQSTSDGGSKMSWNILKLRMNILKMLPLEFHSFSSSWISFAGIILEWVSKQTHSQIKWQTSTCSSLFFIFFCKRFKSCHTYNWKKKSEGEGVCRKIVLIQARSPLPTVYCSNDNDNINKHTNIRVLWYWILRHNVRRKIMRTHEKY